MRIRPPALALLAVVCSAAATISAGAQVVQRRPVTPIARPRIAPPVACSITLSGAESGSVTGCTAAAASSGGRTSLSVAAGQLPAGVATIAVAVQRPGAQPTLGTWTSADGGTAGTVTVESNSHAVWTATHGTGQPAQGSFALTLTSVAQGTTAASSTLWTVHGSLTATLPPVAGSNAAGDVMVTIRF
ncbi:MAG: hypothetical protein KGL93_09250 [Gemmatimonadota bacterium]|nr:hypothetical protein [Gemmatimonadota bacterium]